MENNILNDIISKGLVNSTIYIDIKDGILLSKFYNVPIDYFYGGWRINNVMYYIDSKTIKDYDNLRSKKKRFKDIVEYTFNLSKLMGLSCYFITFTLNDTNINKDFKTIEKHLKERVLKNVDYFKYILNRDYGRTTNRLHYHCLLFSNCCTKELLNYNWGFVDIVQVGIDSTLTNISSYLAKFEKHSYKNTCKLIYSRYNRKHLETYFSRVGV